MLKVNQEVAFVRAVLPATGAAPAIVPPSPIPLSPVLSGASFRHQGHGPVPSILDAGPALLVTSGRVAIALALREMAVGAGDEVLVPAYHCASMIEPVIWSGARPVFYRIRANTEVDLEDLAQRVTARTRVLMATNYFGFPQPLDRLRAFCDARGIQLLEDCAHSFLGQYQGKPLGTWGDYAIASSMKFLPIYEGGCLVSARHTLDGVRLRSAGAGFEAKVAINALEEGCAYRRLGLLRHLLAVPIGVKNALWQRLKARNPARSQDLAPGSSEGGFSFDPAWLDKRSSWYSRTLLRLVSRRRMGALRRRHYTRLHNALSDLPGCRPLFATLPDGVYPWVFPLWVADPQPVFAALKRGGVPVLRFGEFLWPEAGAAVCEASIALSRHVMQFPCHQELREDEVTWLIAQVRASLGNGVPS